MRALDVTPRDGGARWATASTDAWVARRSNFAGIALVLVLLVVGAFAVWSSQVTSGAADAAYGATRLADDYAQASRAVSAEESLERKYRLEPGPAERAAHDAAAAALVASLAAASRHGDASDRARVAAVLADQDRYLAASHQLFAAVDAGDLQAAQRIDTQDADPAFTAIMQAVAEEADDHHQDALSQLTRLDRVEAFSARVTPIVVVAGLLLAALLASIMRGYRRLLDLERTRAIHDSLHDSLTGLPNRTLLATRLAAALRAHPQGDSATALLLIDLDRFKEINDTFGHHYGDELLTQIGPRLRSALREQDTVARLGGDEFAVLLPQLAEPATAVEVAARLCEVLEAPFEIDGVALDIEASIGVVISGVHGDEPTTLLQRADIAMYVAKTQNLRAFVYTPESDRYSPARLALLGELRRGLEFGQLLLHYQPQVNVVTGHLVGAEALVRWEHPERGLVYPDEFIPMAEHTGVIGPLTTYVLRAALVQARAWMDARRPLLVSVNLSARNLLDERLPAEVAGLLAAYGVPAELLQLEVTESAIMTEPARAVRVLEALAMLGVRLSIDDFGAGYTSLSQLRSLPVAELKIDRSFIAAMTDDASDALIVRSIVELGHNLGLTIVAEGVETAGALAALSGFGCDVAQGYYLSRPVGIDAFDSWRSARQHLPTQGQSALNRRLLG